jgi:hypothetical protein
MAINSNIQVTIAFTDPELNSEELEAQAQNLLAQMKDLDEVESVDRALDPNAPLGNKSVGGFIIGLLTVEVSIANFKKLGAFLGDRLSNKPIKLKVKTPDGRELELEASSQQEFDFVYQKAQDFLKG